MKRLRAHRSIALAVASLMISGLARPAFADRTATPEEVASARQLGQEGVQLADAANCDAAIDRLRRAEDLFHAPTILERLGECQVAVGKLVVGTENLNKVIREDLGPKPNPKYREAQERAKKVYDTALKSIGKLRIHVAPLNKGAVPRVKVDGEDVSPAMLDVDRPTDPGSRVVEVSAPGYLATKATVTVPKGGVQTLDITLTIDPNARESPVPEEHPPAPVPPTDRPPTDRFGVSSSPAPDRTPVWIALGVGGAGLAVGTIFGILALSKKSTLDSKCVQKQCPEGLNPDIDSLKSTSTISTIGFVVGIVGVGVGAVLLLTSGKASEASPGSRGKAKVHPWIGLGSAGISGEF